MHTVREFVEKAFLAVGIEIAWKGKGVDEVGYDAKDENRSLVKVDPRYFRPTEVDQLLGDPAKAKKLLGWTPTTLFKDLVKEMVASDVELVKAGDLIN
jgi:GDPmannose 4,6-dehydratase